MVLTVSSAHHTFRENIGFVMIFVIFQTSVGGCGVPETITSMPRLRARTDPEQAPKTQGPQGPVDKSLRQV